MTFIKIHNIKKQMTYQIASLLKMIKKKVVDGRK